MGVADFLLSPAVQALLQVVFAEPARRFPAAELAKLSRLDVAEVEQTLPHLVEAGVLARDDAGAEVPGFGANTAFVFYPELRRIALKSFAAAEPLRAMLRSRFRGVVHKAFVLGEEPTSGALLLLLVYEDAAPEKALLDLALRKLLKTGAIRQHVQADVVSVRRFESLRPGDPLHARLAADTCVDISPPPARMAKPVPERPGLLARARQRLTGFGR